MVETEGKTSYPFVPDVSVTEPGKRKKAGKKKGGTAVAELAAPAEPVAMRAFIAEEHREAFVEIYEAKPEQRLVTSIEVLSPSNKRSGTPGWELYQPKRQSLMLSGVNVVEIDLLRGGQRLPMLDSWPDCPYTLLVARAHKCQLCKVWPAHYRHPLPPIPVPLPKPDPDVTLDLQRLIDSIYQRSRYSQSLDYTKPLNPAFSTEETAWLEGRLRERLANP